MGKYNFNRTVFVGWTITVILAGVYVVGGIRQLMGGPYLSATWLVWLLTALTLCWANTTARELVMMRLARRKTRAWLTGLRSTFRHLISEASEWTREVAGLLTLSSNNHFQTEP